jgi:hypothetical protein
MATHYAGLGYALVSIFPIHIACCVILLAFLVGSRPTWRMKWREVANLVFECAVCPGYFVNICRKLAIGYVHLPGDAIAIGLSQNGEGSTAVFFRGLDFVVEDLDYNHELVDEDRQLIADYKVELLKRHNHE